MKKFAIFMTMISLGGCYPIYKTLQPAVAITVVDESGVPLQGVEVSIISSSFPYGLEKSRVTKISDESGIAYFNSEHEFRVESIIIHGSEQFFWNLCISKKAYETLETHNLEGRAFEPEQTVVLKKGTSKACSTPTNIKEIVEVVMFNRKNDPPKVSSVP